MWIAGGKKIKMAVKVIMRDGWMQERVKEYCKEGGNKMGRGADVWGKTADKGKMEHKKETERDNGEGSRNENKEEKKNNNFVLCFIYFLRIFYCTVFCNSSRPKYG